MSLFEGVCRYFQYRINFFVGKYSLLRWSLKAFVFMKDSEVRTEKELMVCQTLLSWIWGEERIKLLIF